MRPFVKSLVIDSQRKMTVARVITKKKKRSLVYSDHFSCLLTFQNLKRKKEESKGKIETKWNLAKEEGWTKYKELSNIEARKVLEAVEDEGKTVEEVMDKFNKIHDKIKYKAFGKVTIKEKQVTHDRSLDGKSDDEKAEVLFKDQEEVMKKEMNETDMQKVEKVPRAKIY